MNRLLSSPSYWRSPNALPCYRGYRPPNPPNPRILNQQPLSPTLRRTTSTIGIKKTGFIDVKLNESLIYFDNVFPLKTALYDIRYFMMRADSQSVESRVKRQCLPSKLRSPSDPSTFTITSITPHLKDGGAFLKFTSKNPEEIADTISKYLKEKHLKPWFSPFTRVRSFMVRGKPWLEDLHRFPSTRLRVQFAPGAGELSQESLYALFRRYGKIADIILPPPGSKEPTHAIVQFLRIRAATAARNCLHGFTPELLAVSGKEGDTALHIFYERTLKVHWLRDWLASHPRIVLPILAAVLAAITVAIFDPIRTWFIEAKITRSLEFASWGWLKDNTFRFFSSPKYEDNTSALWEERKDAIQQMNGWLQESEETFIVVQGPRGSGKRELVVDSVLSGRKNVLLIDCEPINEAHGDSATIAAAAQQVGYRPVFSWMNSISSMLDIAAQGTIGTKTGFSQTLESQFVKILQNTGVALKQIALSQKGRNEKDKAMADDEYLAAHPERRPVVVIDNFLHTEGKNSIIYDRLSDWAALLVSANVAHVVFLTNDITFSKSLARSLPDRVFRTIFLGDALPESAKRYIMHQIAGDDDTPPAVVNSEKFRKELDQSIAALGGRLTDLEFLARRIKTGESPEHAVNEIIETSAAEILKLFVLIDGQRKWTPEQAWYLVARFAQGSGVEELRYNAILLDDLFKANGEESLQALEHAELIAVVNRGGRPVAVRPGKPVYGTAFKRLVRDRALKARMDSDTLKKRIKFEGETIKKAEEELALLSVLEQKPKQRMAYLLGKIGKSQERIELAEKEVTKLKGVLEKEF